MTRAPSELFDCQRVNDYLDSYLLDQVPPPERRGMRQHIHGCPSCLEKVMARDPLQLFAPLADEAPDGRIWDGFWPAIRDGIAREEGRPRAGRLVARAAAVLLTVAAAAVAFVYLPRLAPRPAAPLPDAAPMVAQRAPAATPATLDRAAPEAPEAPAAVPLPQTVERVRASGSADVQIYTMSYAQGPLVPPGAAETAPPGAPGRPPAPVAELVLIVDKGLQL